LIYYSRGKLDQAVDRLKAAVKADPSFAAAHNNLGVAYEGKRDRAAARAEYQKAVELDPNNKSARANLDRLGER